MKGPRKPPAPTGPELPGLDPTNDGADERDQPAITAEDLLGLANSLGPTYPKLSAAAAEAAEALGDRIDRGEQSGDGREVLEADRAFRLMPDGEPVPLTRAERKARERRLRELLDALEQKEREKKQWTKNWAAEVEKIKNELTSVRHALNEDDKTKGGDR